MAGPHPVGPAWQFKSQ